MSCVESCLLDGGENMPEFYRESRVRSRRARRCSGCPAQIDAGELHQVVVGKWEGGIETYRYHVSCYDLLQAIAAEEMTGWQMNCQLDRCSEEIVTSGRWPAPVMELAVAVIDRVLAADVVAGGTP